MRAATAYELETSETASPDPKRPSAKGERLRQFRIGEQLDNRSREHEVLFNLGVVAPRSDRAPCRDVRLRDHDSTSTGSPTSTCQRRFSSAPVSSRPGRRRTGRGG